MHPSPEQIDDFTLDDADHVLDYDPIIEHGGHRAGGCIPGKDEFPVGWGRVEVKAWVDAILARPSAISPGRWQNSFAFRGTHEGVHGVVWVRSTGIRDSWYIATAYPQPLYVR